MKRSLYILLIAPLFLFSCRKDRGPVTMTKGPSAKRHAVTVSVNNFKLGRGTFALRHKLSTLAVGDTLTNIASYVDQLAYVVLDSNFSPVKKITQDSTSANMGTITDSLAAGTYYICIVTGKNGLAVTPSAALLGGTYDYSGKGWQDTFWAQFKLIIGDHDITRAVTLNRVVGKLEVQLLDNIPGNADSLFITVNGDAIQKTLLDSAFFFGTDTITFKVGIPAAAKGKPNFTFDRLIGAISQPFTVTLTCKDSGGNVIASANGNPVTCYANERTILSGNLFTGAGNNSSSQSFTVRADTAWNTTPNQVNFGLRRH